MQEDLIPSTRKTGLNYEYTLQKPKHLTQSIALDAKCPIISLTGGHDYVR
jgi:hypothetical protein